MILLGDIGNTDTKICLINKKFKIIKKITLSSKNLKKYKTLKKFKIILKKNFLIKKALFCSVVPAQYSNIKSLLYKNFKIKSVELKELNLKKIMKIKVNRKQIGSDRISNSLAVIKKNKNFIIVDFGTATTFDVVVNNEYRGGVIAPGVNLSLKALSNKATLIPKINLKKIKSVIGKNTINAVRSGFFWGYTGLIDNIIDLISKESKKKFTIIITGGFSSLFVKSLKSKVVIDKDITIKGLITAAKLF